MGVPEIISGGFVYTVDGKTLTIAAKGVTKARFKKVGALGDWVILDLSGFTKTFDFDTTFNAAGCGITETASWGSAMPWFDYLINVDNKAESVELGTARNPCASVTPAAANIHYNNAVSATEAQTNFMVARANTVDCAAAPVICIGSHTMTYDTTDDDWTPGAIASTDGFGKFQEGVQFVMPRGQMSAVTTAGGTNNYATHFYNSGGSDANNVPTWADYVANVVYNYDIDRMGTVTLRYSTAACGDCTNGDQATAIYLSLPLQASTVKEASSATRFPCGGGIVAAAATNMGLGVIAGVDYFNITHGTGSLSSLSANALTQVSDDIGLRCSYAAF